MSRPDAIMFKGNYVATQMTEHEKDIWELGQVAGIAWALNNLRAKVLAIGHDSYCRAAGNAKVRGACNCWKRDVLALIDGATDDSNDDA